MKLVKYDKFLEATLSIPLLHTERGGKKRGDVLVKKLEEPNPTLTLNSGDKVDIEPKNAEKVSDEITNSEGEYDGDKAINTFLNTNNRYLPVIKSEKGDEYKLNDFKKDSEFGSSGAGVNTRNYENLQCIYLAHKLVRPDVDLTGENIVRLLEDYNDSSSDISQKIHLHLPNFTKIDDILQDALNSPDWLTTLVDVTNDLYDFSSRNVRLFKKDFVGKYHVYHISSKEDSSPFNIIRNKFKKLLSEISLDSSLSIEFSKYCPADVMVSVNGVDIKSELNNVKNIDDMTIILNSLYSRRLLIPISLKKVGVTVNSIKTYNIIVNNELDRPLPDFEIESFFIYEDMERGIGSKIKVNSSWRDAKGNEIDGDDRLLTIDSANTSNRVNVDGEVEGKFSRHGKISFLYMKYFIDSIRDTINLHNLQVLDEYSKLKDLSENELVSKIQSILMELHDIESIHRRKVTLFYPKRQNSNISTGRLIGSNNRKNKLISKLQSLQVILSIAQVRVFNTRISDEIINKIMRYALSIQADIFITPRYIRVI